jgi:hypothetical protein
MRTAGSLFELEFDEELTLYTLSLIPTERLSLLQSFLDSCSALRELLLKEPYDWARASTSS